MYSNVRNLWEKGIEMRKEKSNRGLQRDIFRTHVILLIAVAIVLSIVGLGISLRAETQKRDLNLQNIAQSIAHSEVLIEELKNSEQLMAETPEELSESVSVSYLESLEGALGDIDVISVVSKDKIRIYHSNHSLIGTEYDGEMPDFVENKSDIYATNSEGPSGYQRRAYAAICDEDGTYLGFVIAVMLQKNIRTQTIHLLLLFVLATFFVVLVELMLSYYLSGKIKHDLFGYEPDTFSAMFKIRDNILESLEEGIVAVNREGNVQFINDAASSMLGIEDKISGETLNEYGKTLLGSTLDSGEKEFHVQEKDFPNSNIIVDRVPIKENGEVAGAIGILHDRTEYTRLMEDLSGTRYLVDSMRANNHDFTNKLHVILGLIQMGMSEEAIQYIENITIVQREIIGTIMKSIDDPAVAALLIGKTARAAECDVEFILREGSSFVRADYPIPSETLVTVIGNLIDNALDAMNLSEESYEEHKELLFGIFSKPGALLITVDDNGVGISRENLNSIFVRGFSTKGEGRGTGLYETKKLVERFGGEIIVESQEQIGTSFMVSFKKGNVEAE